MRAKSRACAQEVAGRREAQEPKFESTGSQWPNEATVSSETNAIAIGSFLSTHSPRAQQPPEGAPWLGRAGGQGWGGQRLCVCVGVGLSDGGGGKKEGCL